MILILSQFYIGQPKSPINKSHISPLLYIYILFSVLNIIKKRNIILFKFLWKMRIYNNIQIFSTNKHLLFATSKCIGCFELFSKLFWIYNLCYIRRLPTFFIIIISLPLEILYIFSFFISEATLWFTLSVLMFVMLWEMHFSRLLILKFLWIIAYLSTEHLLYSFCLFVLPRFLSASLLMDVVILVLI